MREQAAGAPASDPADGQPAATGDASAPAAVTDTETPPEWLDAATELLGRDPETSLIDTDQALTLIAWLSREVFLHAKTDRPHHTKAALLEQIQATQAVLNSVSAVQHVRVAQYAATAESEDPELEFDPDIGDSDRHREHSHPLGHVCEFTDVDLAPVMHWGPMQAVRRIDDAVDAVAKTPKLLDEMGDGHLDATRVAQVTGELLEAGDTTCRRVQDRLLERGITGWTSRQTQNRARTLVRRLDRAAAKQTKKKRAKHSPARCAPSGGTPRIGSFTRPGPEHGLTEWNLILPTVQALPAVQAVEDLARQLHQDTNTDKTLGQCRVDAFCDLVLGHAEVRTTVNVLVPIKTSAAATNPGTSPSDGADTNARSDTSNGDAARPVGDHDSGARSVTDSWVETMMTDYNWDAALLGLISDVKVRQEYPSSETSDDSPAGQTNDPPDPDPPDFDPPDDQNSPDTPHDEAPLTPTPLCLPDVELPGLGVIPADAVQDLLRTLGTRLARSLVDWRTGTLIETSCDTYRPTATIRRHVLQRDAHCRFPGCERPARFCDVDHVAAWPRGATEVSNLQCLCRHHHRAKHETRWQVAMTPDGTCTWTSPTARDYTTHPGNLEVTADLHVTPGTPCPSDDGDLLRPT